MKAVIESEELTSLLKIGEQAPSIGVLRVGCSLVEFWCFMDGVTIAFF
jgi:hypothetical protein